MLMNFDSFYNLAMKLDTVDFISMFIQPKSDSLINSYLENSYHQQCRKRLSVTTAIQAPQMG